MEKWSQIVDFLEKSWIKRQLHIKFKKAQTLKKKNIRAELIDFQTDML